MSERMLRPGGSDRPKEGIYLDAALAVVGEQLDERIDELSRRRRLRTRVGVAALAVFAVASGGVAAVALSGLAPAPASPAALSAEHEVRCVEGADSDDAYFTVRYRTAEGEADADAVRLCAQARSAIAGGFEEFRAASPKELRAIAEGFIADALPHAEGGFAAGTDEDAGVDVADTAFRPVAGPRPATPVTCVRDRSTLVLWVPDASPSRAERGLLCARAGS